MDNKKHKKSSIDQPPTLIAIMGSSSEEDKMWAPETNPEEEVTAECTLFEGSTIGDRQLNTTYNDFTGMCPI